MRHRLVWCLAVPCWVSGVSAEGASFHPCAVPGWKLALQAWTFHHLTLFETIDECRAAGIEYLEAFPGQRISPAIEAGFAPNAGDAALAAVRAKLEESGVKLVAYGVTGIGGDEGDVRRLFDFAKSFGIECINTEMDGKMAPMVDALCEEYGLRVGIHNHPAPSRYWNPEAVLAAFGEAKRIGACADTGHWARSGLTPVECIEQLGGHLVSLHLKDVERVGDKGVHDIPFGTGVCDIRAILGRLRQQGFQGVISIEYEWKTDHLADDLKRCVAFFHQVADELAAQ